MDVDPDRVPPQEVLLLLETGRERVARAWTGDKVEVALALQQVLPPGSPPRPCKVCLLTALWLDPDTGQPAGDITDPHQSAVRVAAHWRLRAAVWPSQHDPDTWAGDLLQDWNDAQPDVAPVLGAYDRAIDAVRAEVGVQ